MGCCNDINKNIPFFVELYKYLEMAKYKAKQQVGRTTHKGYHFTWRKCTQEQLAFAYEELGLTDFVEKQSNEKQAKTTKAEKSSKTDKGQE